MRIGMMMAAATCLLLGILPTLFIGWMDTIPVQLVGSTISASAGTYGWLWLTPVAPERASYSGIIVFLGILAVVAAAYIMLHVKPGAIRRGHVWDCGFEKLTERMQYNATSFSMPIRRIFGYLFNIKEQVDLAQQSAHSAFPKRLITTSRCVTAPGDGFTNQLPRRVSGYHARSGCCSKAGFRHILFIRL